MEKKKYKILFVCLGNICRSPAANGIMEDMIKERGLADRFEIDSAGTYGGHSGSLPDNRMRAHAAKRGYKLTHHSRQVHPSDFEEFDLIVAMDDRNFANLKALAPDLESEAKICRMMDYSTTGTYDHVPDPYYSGADGFELVLDLLEDSCRNMLDSLNDKQHTLPVDNL